MEYHLVCLRPHDYVVGNPIFWADDRRCPGGEKSRITRRTRIRARIQIWKTMTSALPCKAKTQQLVTFQVISYSVSCPVSTACTNPHSAEIFCINHGEQRVFQLKNIINVLVSSFRFIWIPMLWVYDHWKYFDFFSAGIVFIRQNLTSIDVRFWRIKTVPVLKGLKPNWTPTTNTVHNQQSSHLCITRPILDKNDRMKKCIIHHNFRDALCLDLWYYILFFKSG